MTRNSFYFRNKEYPSASAALDAYIQDFDGTDPRTFNSHDMDVLLTSMSRSQGLPVEETRRNSWDQQMNVTLKWLVERSYEKLRAEELKTLQGVVHHVHIFFCLSYS